VAHGLRALAAVIASGLCVCFIYAAFSDRGGLRASRERVASLHTGAFSGNQPGNFQLRTGPITESEVIEQYINDIELGFLIPAGISAVAAATLLSWPARRQQPPTHHPLPLTPSNA
jgi:hypothetical protein